jgi:hypothetical protein
MYYLDVSTSSTFSTRLTNYNNLLLSDVSSWPVTGLTARKTYYYRVRAGNASGTSGNSNTIKPTTLRLKSAEIASSVLPESVELAIYPNPFRTAIAIDYSIPEESKVSIEVFDIQGRMVKILVNETQQTGDYQCTWDATGSNNARVNPGLYLCRFKAGDHTEMLKLVLQ